jgi:PAS domain S-box-containing protein
MENKNKELLQEFEDLQKTNFDLEIENVKLKQLNRELKEREERWLYALDGAEDGVWDWNAQTNVVFFSRQWKAMLGFEENEIGNTIDEWDKRIHPDDKKKCYEDIEKHLKGETPFYKNEHRVLCKDGNYKWILDRGKIIQWDDNGKPLRVIGTHVDISEHKQIELELQESESRFKSMFEKHNAIMLLIEPGSGQIIDANLPACNFYGYTKSKLCTMSINEINTLPPDQVALERQKALEEQRNYFIFPHRLASGDERIVEVHSSPIIFGETRILFSIVHDITERKQVEKALKESEEKYRTLVQYSSDPIFSFNPDETYKFVNETFAKTLGKLPEEIIGKTPHAIFPHEEAERRLKLVRQVFLTEKKGEIEVKVVTPTGKEIYFITIADPIKDEQGKICWVSCISKNITERKQSEHALKEREAKFSSMISNISDVIGIIGIDGLIQYKSPNISKWFGWQPQDLIGTDGWLTVHPDDLERIQKEFFTLLEEDNSVKQVEYRYKCKDNSYKYIKLTATNLTNDPTICGVLMNYHDITERKQAEETIQLQNLKLMEANASKDKLFSIIAHDLKGPFTAILGLIELMQEPNTSLDEMQTFSKMIFDSANNFFKLLENLLTWARTQRGSIEFKPENYDLFIIVSQNITFLREFANQKNIELINQIPNHIEVFVDIEMINTVFRNLISNAIKFTPRGGKIIISAEKKDNEILITIEDTGIGMNEKILNGIFKMDQRTSRPGTEKETSTGLGLLLCKEFIEKHNGKIWVESEEDKGSTFYFTLHEL